jgi:exodeoxyribonuclease V alpha subunit
VSEEATIIGEFESYRFAKSSGWAVGLLKDRTMIVGNFAEVLTKGCEYEFHGTWDTSDQYGKQFKAKSWRASAPHSQNGVVNYLFRNTAGIGPVTAQALWDQFGSEAVKVLRSDWQRAVAECKRLKPNIAKAASEALQQVAKHESVTIDLTDLFAGRGFQHALVDLCIKKWGLKAAETIRRDSFKLYVNDMPSAGFARCDRMYLDNGGPPGRLKRQTIAMYAALHEDGSGSTWLPAEKCVEFVWKKIGAGVVLNPQKALRLGVRARWFSQRTFEVAGEKKPFVAEAEKAWDEWKLAEKIKELMAASEGPWLDAGEFALVTPHQRQQAAKAVSGNVGILGGAPGTGKSFTLAAMLKVARKKFGSQSIAVVSPTGKASVRITQAILDNGIADITATTIHRLLKPMRNGRDGGGYGFFHGPEQLLPHDLICVEEASMLDTTLAADLVCAIKPGAKLLFVGDFRQLPPVGHGKPLLDMIEAGVPYGMLTEIKRNSGDIVRVSGEVNAGAKYAPSTGPDWKAGDNVLHYERRSASEQLRALRQMYAEAPAEFDRVSDIQVLAVTNESSSVARKQLNETLQGLLNADGAKVGETIFRVGDKAICTENGELTEVYCVNCGDKGIGMVALQDSGEYGCLRCGVNFSKKELDEEFVANGEMGKVLDIGGGVLHVLFEYPRRLIRFTGEQVNRVDLAYAISVHRAQGSQWPVVVLMIDDATGAAMVASRQLTMTALSRAEKLAVTIGKKAVVDGWVMKDAIADRVTYLRELLTK